MFLKVPHLPLTILLLHNQSRPIWPCRSLILNSRIIGILQGVPGSMLAWAFPLETMKGTQKNINYPGLYPLLCNTLGFPLLRLIILRLHNQSRPIWPCRSLNLNSRIIGILQGVSGSMLAWAFPLETMKGTQKT